MSETFNLGSDHLSVGIALAIARGECRAVLTDEVRSDILKNRQAVDTIVEKGETFLCL